MEQEQRFRIKLTPAEKKWAEWAIDPMSDYFEEQVRLGEIKQMPELPQIEKDELLIPANPDIQDDLLYRLQKQAPAVCETDADSAMQVAARCRSALRLAKKIEGSGVKLSREIPDSHRILLGVQKLKE